MSKKTCKNKAFLNSLFAERPALFRTAVWQNVHHFFLPGKNEAWCAGLQKPKLWPIYILIPTRKCISASCKRLQLLNFLSAKRLSGQSPKEISSKMHDISTSKGSFGIGTPYWLAGQGFDSEGPSVGWVDTKISNIQKNIFNCALRI